MAERKHFVFDDASTGSERSKMEWLEVLRRIEAGEDRRTEFKRGLGDLSAIGRALCAFGNGDGGLIVLGVDDAGAIVGVREDAEQVQERLTGFLQTGCNVPVSARLGRYEAPGGWVHWVEVLPQSRGFEPLHCSGRFWIRRARSSVQPSPAELQELSNNFGFVLTEEQVIRAASIKDIDFAAFRAFLRTQGLDIDGEWCRSLGRREDYRDIRREDVPLIPDRALREALVNAVIHREYAIAGSPVLLEVFNDRVDVMSPGALPNHMAVESVRSGSRLRSRNESMAHAMVVAGLMERRGRGWPLMRRAMREFNGTEPEIVNDEREKFVRVTFRLEEDCD